MNHSHGDLLSRAPDWSLWIGHVGRGSIALALVAFLLAAVLWGVSVRTERTASRLFTAGCSGLLMAFGSLLSLLLGDQFQFAYVFDHSERVTDVQYKVAALWAGQEGSFLLWACCGAVFGLLAARRAHQDRRWFTVAYSVFLASLAGILAYESPFRINLIDGQPLMPPDGNGMVPALLNYWITIHPPVIFLGFGSLAVLTFWAMSACLRRDLDSWVPRIRPWAILSATFLGLGLCMGGFWAYETLGWGGFWAWDPVENTSFVPWVWVIALIHGLFIQAARGSWRHANALLAGTALPTFLYGTFLTRSGFLKDTSVHSFAEMNRTALWILAGASASITLVVIASWFACWFRSRGEAQVERAQPESPLNLSNGYSAMNWLMLFFAVAAAVGMSVPLFMAIAGKAPKVVEEHVYHMILAWPFVPTMALLACAPFVTWRGIGMRMMLSRISSAFALSLGLLGLLMLWMRLVPNTFKPEATDTIELPLGYHVQTIPWVLFLAWLCLFALSANLWRMGELWKRARPSAGGVLTHVGVAMALAGLMISRGFERKEQIVVQKDRPAFALGYRVSLIGRTADYLTRENQVKFEFSGLSERFISAPTLFYQERPDREPQPVVRPDIKMRGLYDLYIAIAPMVFEVGEPLEMKPGQTADVDGVLVTYRGFRRDGEAGQAGTRFFADLDVQHEGKTVRVSPSMSVGEGGPTFDTVPAGPYFIAMNRMDAATKGATLEFFYAEPLFPIEVYYKPLTVLVWTGTGIMTLGGFWAAWSRRRNLRVATERANEEASSIVEPKADAPASTAQS